MKIDGLEFADALQVERRRQILGHVDVQMISIWVDETGQRTRDCCPDVISRSAPCILPRPVEQLFPSRSQRVREYQDDAYKKCSVQIRPDRCDEWQTPEPRVFSVLHCPVEYPAEYCGHQRSHKMRPGKPMNRARGHGQRSEHKRE